MIPSNATAKPPRVLFLADSGPDVGGGHVMRCLTLAGALRDLGAACAFVDTPTASEVLNGFAGPQLERLPAAATDVQALALQAEVLARNWRAEVVVVDHYGLTAYHETRLRTMGRRIVVLDDLARRPHDCDLLMDSALGRTLGDYRPLLPSGAVVLTGPEYALLRPEFAAARDQTLARRRSGGPVRRLLISLGLTDLLGITGRVVNLIRPALAAIQVDVVLGADAPSLTWLKRLVVDDPRVRLHVGSLEMARLIGDADMAIGAGGSSTWERACLGLAAIDLVLADNQKALALDLDGAEATIAIDVRGGGFAQRMTTAFALLSGDEALRARLSSNSAALCDGQGARRTAEAIMALVV